MKFEGGCYCGKVRYRAEGEPVMKAQCHCRECQYITGGSANVFMAMPVATFAYSRGAPRRFARADLAAPCIREFCPDCGTHLTTRAPGLDAVIVKVGTLDDPAAYGGPDIAIFTVDKQAFQVVPDGVAAFERLPG